MWRQLHREGVMGLSNHPAWQVTQALWIADDRHLTAARVCAQVETNLIDRAAEDKLVPARQQFGLLRRRAAASDAIRPARLDHLRALNLSGQAKLDGWHCVISRLDL
jgi:hypothetical protein